MSRTDFGGAGFRLWNLVCARTRIHRLKPAPQEACLSLERLEQFDKKDVKVLLFWILAGILGAVVAYTYFFRAFPEASVEFKVSRPDALARARQFAAAQGAKL